jgi:hypothetical protein
VIDYGPEIPASLYLRAFDDPALRGVLVNAQGRHRVYVEPWTGKHAAYRAVRQGGTLGGEIRTKGEPASMRKMYEEHGKYIREAAEHFDMPEAWIAGMCGIEAVPGGGMRWNTRSCREEPGFISDSETPHRVSPGPMQTLISTAEAMRVKYFPAWAEIQEREQLFDQRRSFMLGAAYMQHQRERYGDHPVMLCGGYNAGRAKRSDESEFGVKTYSPTRVIKFLAWINDYAAVLDEV